MAPHRALSLTVVLEHALHPGPPRQGAPPLPAAGPEVHPVEYLHDCHLWCETGLQSDNAML